MSDYKELLRSAKEALPKLSVGEERFKLPEPHIFRSGKQTIIKNFMEISKTLRRDPKHLAKFMFKELAVPGSIRGSELLLQGKFYPRLIRERLGQYVKEYVRCIECGKVDTVMTKHGKVLTIKCEACGAKRSGVD
jgi:translation initiation factor 2 subunit 2